MPGTWKFLAASASLGRPLPAYDPDAYAPGARRNFVIAVRAVLGRDEIARWIDGNPAQELTVPAGGDRVHHLTATQFLAWLAVGCTTGRDHEVDRLLLYTLRHTAEGMLNLTLDALDPVASTLRSCSKYGIPVTRPVNRQLPEELLAHARSRGARHGWDRVFRFRDGSLMTGRRFDTLTHRLKQRETWAAPLTIGPHSIRRLTLTEIDREFGPVVATAWAGHSRRRLGSIAPHLRPAHARGVAPGRRGPVRSTGRAPAAGRLAGPRAQRGRRAGPHPAGRAAGPLAAGGPTPRPHRPRSPDRAAGRSAATPGPAPPRL